MCTSYEQVTWQANGLQKLLQRVETETQAFSPQVRHQLPALKDVSVP